MNIIVKNLIENEDGSADVELEIDEPTKMILIQEGFLSILKEWIELQKDANKKTKGTL